jgi:UDP-GlcNAc:undecaprenyl-phosphate/decaprenyl-phosphate GlcNAc-1-phosphate transferase
MNYLLYFIISAGLAVFITPWISRLASRFGFVDIPNQPRKIHSKPMPMLGGWSLYIVFLVVSLVYVLFGSFSDGMLSEKWLAGIFLGGLVLMIGGALDDKYRLPAKVTVLFPLTASIIAVWFGIGSGITALTNPFGGHISLAHSILGVSLSGLVVGVWIMGMVYTTKLLDGLDGLASGIALIGGLTMFFLSLTEKVNQPSTATLAIIFAGSLAGYLVYAFNPAKIFLGESGSTFIGFILGVLSVIAGAKIATALLVMGIPILDVAWAIVRRLATGRSPFSPDRQHLHFRLLDLGFSQRQTVLILYGLSAVFGFTAVFLQSKGKLIALGILFCVMIGLIISLVFAYKRLEKSKILPIDDKAHN